MLEKKSEIEKKIFVDAHFHYARCVENHPDFLPDWPSVSCAHSESEWKVQENAPLCVKRAFGLHPQASAFCDFDFNKTADFLENLLKEKNAALPSCKINAIGEAGFDFFTPQFKEKRELQEKMWNVQLELALFYNMPLVVHARRANEKLFEYACRLKKLPAVLFHSFMGSPVEALSLIRRGINCSFSFGKQLLNGNKKVIECAKLIPMENLLLETDAPFQTLKGEEETLPSEIERVYKAFLELRSVSPEEAFLQLEKNFFRIFENWQ